MVRVTARHWTVTWSWHLLSLRGRFMNVYGTRSFWVAFQFITYLASLLLCHLRPAQLCRVADCILVWHAFIYEHLFTTRNEHRISYVCWYCWIIVRCHSVSGTLAVKAVDPCQYDLGFILAVWENYVGPYISRWTFEQEWFNIAWFSIPLFYVRTVVWGRAYAVRVTLSLKHFQHFQHFQWR